MKRSDNECGTNYLEEMTNMAISKRFKTIYEENGYEFVFSSRTFKNEVISFCSNARREGTKFTQDQILNELGERLNKSPEAVKQWMRGNNGPSDISVVKDIADYFDTDFKNFLIPKKIINDKTREIEFKITPDDEKSIVLQFHAILSDFIYDYIGGDMRDLFIERLHDIYMDDIDKEIQDYIFNLYKQLERVSLILTPDTYKKLHRFITECKVFSYNGVYEATPHFCDLLQDNPRWAEINPYLNIIAEYASFTSFDGALFFLPKEKVDSLVAPIKLETDCGHLLWEDNDVWQGYRSGRVGMGVDDKEEYISKEEAWDYYFFEPHEAVPMELAKTLTLLFRADFPQYFGLQDKES